MSHRHSLQVSFNWILIAVLLLFFILHFRLFAYFFYGNLTAMMMNQAVVAFNRYITVCFPISPPFNVSHLAKNSVSKVNCTSHYSSP